MRKKNIDTVTAPVYIHALQDPGGASTILKMQCGWGSVEFYITD